MHPLTDDHINFHNPKTVSLHSDTQYICQAHICDMKKPPNIESQKKF